MADGNKGEKGTAKFFICTVRLAFLHLPLTLPHAAGKNLDWRSQWRPVPGCFDCLSCHTHADLYSHCQYVAPPVCVPHTLIYTTRHHNAVQDAFFAR